MKKEITLYITHILVALSFYVPLGKFIISKDTFNINPLDYKLMLGIIFITISVVIWDLRFFKK